MTQTAKRILVVDDEVALNQLVSTNLMLEGYDVLAAYDGAEALRIMQADEPDLVVLDVMMPDMDGFEVLQQIRSFSTVPVIMLTARIRIADKVKGLTSGADDYVAKPFSMEELLARIEAVLRRAAGSQAQPKVQEVLSCGPLRANVSEHRVWTNGTEVPLQRLEFKLLVALMRAEGRVLSHDFLLSTVWDDREGDLATLRVTIGKLRRKLEEASGTDLVETVHGVGYRLTA